MAQPTTPKLTVEDMERAIARVTRAGLEVGEVQFTPAPQAIVFYSDGREALRITMDGVTADPSVPVDEAARAIYKALEAQIKALGREPDLDLEAERRIAEQAMERD